MTRDEIYSLSCLIPRDTSFFSGSPFQIFAEDDVSYATEKFAKCYSNPSFAWHLLKLYSDADKQFPIGNCITLSRLDEYEILRDAYWFQRQGVATPELLFAVSIDRALDPYYKSVLRSCLLIEDICSEEIAAKTGIPKKSVEIYEKLFFNVWDRKEDQLYISSQVYPEGVFSELDPNYQARTNYMELLKKAGYRNGIEEVMSLAGVRGYSKSGNTQALVAEFENKLMANAVFLSDMGLLNTRNQVGISNAKNLLAAAKHGGDTELAGNDLIGLGGIGDAMSEEIELFNQDVSKDQRAYSRILEEDKIEREKAS